MFQRRVLTIRESGKTTLKVTTVTLKTRGKKWQRLMQQVHVRRRDMMGMHLFATAASYTTKDSAQLSATIAKKWNI